MCGCSRLIDRARRAAVALVLVLGGCVTAPPAPVAERATVPAGFPTEPYAAALAQGEAVYRIEPENS